MLPELVLPCAATIVSVSPSRPVQLVARCMAQANDKLTLELDEAASFREGELVVLELGAPPVRALVVVSPRTSRQWDVQVRWVPRQDPREFPRVNGGVGLMYHVLDRLDPLRAAEAWLAGGAADGQEVEPDPYMNFSASGLAFDDGPTCAEHELLGLRLALPGQETVWRGVALVVRVAEIPPDQQDEVTEATHRVAVEFTDLPTPARNALAAHAERIREAAISRG